MSIITPYSIISYWTGRVDSWTASCRWTGQRRTSHTGAGYRRGSDKGAGHWRAGDQGAGCWGAGNKGAGYWGVSRC